MKGKTGINSNINMDIFAKSLPQSSYQEEFHSRPIIDAEVEFERISSSNSQFEDNSASKSETSSEAKFEQKKHSFNIPKFSSDSGQDLYPIKIIVHFCTSLP